MKCEHCHLEIEYEALIPEHGHRSECIDAFRAREERYQAALEVLTIHLTGLMRVGDGSKFTGDTIGRCMEQQHDADCTTFRTYVSHAIRDLHAFLKAINDSAAPYSQELTAADYERERKALYKQAVDADARAKKFLELIAMIADHVDPVFCSVYMERRDVEPWIRLFAAADFEVFKKAFPYMAEAFEDEMKDSPRQAAVAYIEHDDGRLLCVWNRRYGGWSLPGGLVEEGESVPAALARELREETSLVMVTHEPIFSGEHNLKAGVEAREGRASMVHIYRVQASGAARECEEGCPITWLTRKEFLKWSPFAPFYEKVFQAVAPRGK